jgi:AcrR family transcriptional regulator
MLTERESETAKERILRISAQLFARNGYTATGIQEISDAVGLGRGALYHHIKSKEMLLYEISIALLEDMHQRATAIVSDPIDWEEKIHRLAADLMEDLAERRAGWTVSLSETRAMLPDHAAAVIKARDAYESVWADVFEEARHVGALPMVSPVVRRGVLGMLNSAHLWISSSGELAPREIGRQYVDVLINGLRSERDSAAR